MINFFYEAWNIITILSIVVGLIVAVISLQSSLVKRMTELKPLRVFIIILAVLAVIFLCTSCYVKLQYTKVPNVVSLTLKEAEESLNNADLQLSLENDEDISENYFKNVVSQSINDNDIVKKGTKIIVTLDNDSENSSNTPNDDDQISQNDNDQVTVPNVVGMEQTEAIGVLTSKGLQFQVWWNQEDESTEPYYIKSQSIPSGSIVKIGTEIKLQLTSENNN